MVILSKMSKTLWLVQYNGNLFTVRDHSKYKLGTRGITLKRIKHIIAKTTKQNASKFRHVENRLEHGKWSSYWIEI